MTFKIRVHRKTNEVLMNMPKHGRAHQNGLRLALHEIGGEVAKEDERLIRQGPKTGRKYSGLPNRSSAPHEAAANQSGKLIDSIDYKVKNWQSMEVGETVDYAEFLAKGTSRMAPRDQLIMAVNNKARDAVRIMEEMTDREIKNL